MKSDIILRAGIVPRISQMEELFKETKWNEYDGTSLAVVQRSLAHSMDIITAWDGEELIGLLRCVGDYYTILYVQDIVVKSNHRRQGVGQEMLARLLSRYPTVKTRVVIAENTPEISAFCHSCGFTEATSLGRRAYIQIQNS